MDGRGEYVPSPIIWLHPHNNFEILVKEKIDLKIGQFTLISG